MAVASFKPQILEYGKSKDLLNMLDRGIDDMEQGRELSLEEAFQKISELRDSRRNGRV